MSASNLGAPRRHPQTPPPTHTRTTEPRPSPAGTGEQQGRSRLAEGHPKGSALRARGDATNTIDPGGPPGAPCPATSPSVTRGCRSERFLQERRDAMVFPRRELVTGLLDPEDLMLRPDPERTLLREIDTSRFNPATRDRATGGYQIVHGDVARACGYCAGLRVYQKPSPVWTKATEDRAFRWLLRTQGVGIDLPGVYRIRHAAKGRYQGSKTVNRVREALRRWQSRRRYGERDGRIQSSESAV